MNKSNIHCKNICVIEGVFGEIFPESKDEEEKVLDKASPSVGDHPSRRNRDEPINIKSYTLRNMNRMEVVLITWGATIVTIKCPDKYGDAADVILGFDDLNSYLDPILNEFMGCILGRCANRIRNAKFCIKDKDYFLTKNDSDRHHLHGGLNGFGRQIWESYVDENCQVIMSYLSQDGEEGYPGAVLVTVKFALTNNNRLEIKMRATTSKPTVVNLSYGSLFNLAGHFAGEQELRQHKITLNCDRWTSTDLNDPLIPNGEIKRVGGTIMDLRIARTLDDIIDKIPTRQGFDHNFCVVRSYQPEISFVSRAYHPKSGRFLEVYSDQPGVHFQTGGHLPPHPLPCKSSTILNSSINNKVTSCESCECTGCDCTSGSSEVSVKSLLETLPGKCGVNYKRFGAFSLQPQNYPNAINVDNFPSTILKPGQVYYHDLVYKFGVQLNDDC